MCLAHVTIRFFIHGGCDARLLVARAEVGTPKSHRGKQTFDGEPSVLCPGI